MIFQHKKLSQGGWQKLPFFEQMANIGSENETDAGYYGNRNEIRLAKKFLSKLKNDWGDSVEGGVSVGEGIISCGGSISWEGGPIISSGDRIPSGAGGGPSRIILIFSSICWDSSGVISPNFTAKLIHSSAKAGVAGF